MALTTIDPALQNTQAQYTGFKNRIINGAMMIDQRNAGASVSNANGYTVDRWYFLRGASSSSPVFNVQQSTTVPPNYKNSLSVTVGTSGAPGTSNYSALLQNIEGLNISDLGWGSATASTVTLSFWVNCSVTGTYGVALQNSGSTRSYIASYTVNAANTWEQKTITIAGDTTGTWLTTTGQGVAIYWDMGVGTTQSTTAGTWQAGNYLGLTGGTKLSNTGSATFYITGVQLEKGSTATSFDYRPYGTELALCQRYFETIKALQCWSGGSGSTLYTNITYAVPKRAAATLAVTGALAFTEPAVGTNTQSSGNVGLAGFSVSEGVYAQFANLSVTTQRFYVLNTVTTYVTASAEL